MGHTINGKTSNIKNSIKIRPQVVEEKTLENREFTKFMPWKPPHLLARDCFHGGRTS